MRASAKACGLLVLISVCGTSAWGRHRRPKRAPLRHAGEHYVAKVATRRVAAGDTLWRLTGEVTGKPWVWPQIWALNPTLTNPHWLVPGQTIQFAPDHGGRGLHVASFMPAPQQLQSIDAEGQAQQTPLHVADTAAAASGNDIVPQPRPASAPAPGAAPAMRVAAALPPQRCLPAMILPRSAKAQLARIAPGSAEGLMWRKGDTFLLQWPEHATRDNGPWAVIRLPADDDNAEAGGEQGMVVTCTGTAEAVADDAEKRPQGRLLSLRQEVEAGQYVVPLAQMQLTDAAAVATPPQEAPMCGALLSIEQGALAASPMHLVFFNRGSKQGVRIGTHLLSKKDAAHAHDDALLVVVHATEHASTAKVLRASREVSVGQAFCVAAGATP